MSQFRPAKKRIAVSVGESERIVRALQGLSQNQLAGRSFHSGKRQRLLCLRPTPYTHCFPRHPGMARGAVFLLPLQRPATTLSCLLLRAR